MLPVSTRGPHVWSPEHERRCRGLGTRAQTKVPRLRPPAAGPGAPGGVGQVSMHTSRPRGLVAATRKQQPLHTGRCSQRGLTRPACAAGAHGRCSHHPLESKAKGILPFQQLSFLLTTFLCEYNLSFQTHLSRTEQRFEQEYKRPSPQRMFFPPPPQHLVTEAPHGKRIIARRSHINI